MNNNNIIYDCRHVFCYGSLRPDDDSGMPWTVEAIKGMTAQPATLLGAKLYRDEYASVVLNERPGDAKASHLKPDTKDKVKGWVLTTADPALWQEKMELYDEIEEYKEDGTGQYQRDIVDVYLGNPGSTIGGDAIGESVTFIKAYVYHRPDCNKDDPILSGDWLRRDES